MKNTFSIGAYLNIAKACFLVGIISTACPPTSKAEVMQPAISFQVFYDELLPYGDWISDPVHGYVWVPYAGPDFQPYASNGYWVMTTYGNTWVSNYDWGWAPFHYGRWYFDDYLGWAWVPGYEWGPAWVNWRTGGDYYGWAPLMPGLGIHVAINIPSNYWVFVPKRRIVSRNVYNYYVPRKNVYKIYNQTTIINNTYVYNNNTYVSGPARRDVERVSRRSVPVYQVNNSNRPGRTSVSRNAVQVYQPSIRQSAGNTREAQARPSRILSANEHKKNVASRSSSRSAANTRTVPASSRETQPRTSETIRENQVITRQEAATRGTAPANGNNTRTQTPSRNQRTASPARQTESKPQTRQQPNIRANQSGQVTRQSSASPRGQVPGERSRSNISPRTQKDQPARQSPTRTQEVKRSSSTTNVSQASSTRERSSGNTSRSSSPSRSASRGNN